MWRKKDAQKSSKFENERQKSELFQSNRQKEISLSFLMKCIEVYGGCNCILLEDLSLNCVDNKETDKAVYNFVEIMNLKWISNPLIN